MYTAWSAGDRTYTCSVKARLTSLLKPNLIGFAVFVACFALHIIAGQLDLGALFTIAVVLIWAAAAGFPVLIWAITRGSAGAATLGLAFIIGVALTTAVIGATRDSGFELVNLVGGAVVVAAVSAVAIGLRQRIRRPAARPA